MLYRSRVSVTAGNRCRPAAISGGNQNGRPVNKISNIPPEFKCLITTSKLIVLFCRTFLSRFEDIWTCNVLSTILRSLIKSISLDNSCLSSVSIAVVKHGDDIIGLNSLSSSQFSRCRTLLNLIVTLAESETKSQVIIKRCLQF